MADYESQGRARLTDRIKTFISLNIENIRLTVAEKVIVLLTAILTTAIILIFGSIAMFFIAVAIANFLSIWLPTWVAYSIVAAANIVVLLVVMLFRRRLIINPVSRAISRIILS